MALTHCSHFLSMRLRPRLRHTHWQQKATLPQLALRRIEQTNLSSRLLTHFKIRMDDTTINPTDMSHPNRRPSFAGLLDSMAPQIGFRVERLLVPIRCNRCRPAHRSSEWCPCQSLRRQLRTMRSILLSGPRGALGGCHFHILCKHALRRSSATTRMLQRAHNTAKPTRRMHMSQ